MNVPTNRPINPTCPRCGAICLEVPPLGTTDARDIEIKVVNGSSLASEALRQVYGRYKLRNYRGPISSITVQCDHNFFVISIRIHVVDVGNGSPIRLSVEKAYPRWLLDANPKDFFENSMRQAIQWTHNHELDESFVCDGEFVTNPHPEEEALTA